MSTRSTNLPGEGDFTLEEVQALERDDVFGARTSPGERKVFRVVHSHSWDDPTYSSSLATEGATTRFIGNKHQRHDSFVMPTAAISAEALEYMGFLRLTSQCIFHQFQNRPDPDNNTDTLMDYVIRHVSQVKTILKGNHTFDQAMIQVGLTECFRKRVKICFIKRIPDPYSDEDKDEYEDGDENEEEEKADKVSKTFLGYIIADLRITEVFLNVIHGNLKHRARELIAINPDWSMPSKSASIPPRARLGTKKRSRISRGVLGGTKTSSRISGSMLGSTAE
ncbi:hypothetical protein ACLOAV_007798 [Pseudogymnoascus australis]